MNENLEYIPQQELTAEEAKTEVMEALDDQEREMSGVRRNVEIRLSQYPDLRSDLEIFRRIATRGSMFDLLAWATPEVLAQIPNMAKSTGEAKIELLDYFGKASSPFLLIARIKAYLEIYPDLKDDYDLFVLVAKDSTLQHLLVFASEEVMAKIDAEEEK